MNPTERQRAARRRKRRNLPRYYFDVSRQPVTLTLADYRAADARTTDWLVAEFGERGALRVLNGDSPARSAAPADPATVAPPGAKAWPRKHHTKGEARMRETSGA